MEQSVFNNYNNNSSNNNNSNNSNSKKKQGAKLYMGYNSNEPVRMRKNQRPSELWPISNNLIFPKFHIGGGKFNYM